LKILKTKCTTLSDDLFLCQVSKGSAVRFPRNVPDKIDAEEKSGIRIIMITRFDCVWMQTQKSPNDPHIRIQACGCKFHHYQPIPHFKILLDINFH
jgi:hypothetical protein